ALNLNTEALDEMAPEITWKGQPLSIAHLPHYDALHPTEAHVVSVLRLTPVQYLTGKYTLVSAAQRYVHRALPFKKSDAQKLLRIDVNKASKLWEFFRQNQNDEISSGVPVAFDFMGSSEIFDFTQENRNNRHP
ncbi:1304_t:CDS:2, partial [Acaulospora morrowiae]